LWKTNPLENWATVDFNWIKNNFPTIQELLKWFYQKRAPSKHCAHACHVMVPQNEIAVFAYIFENATSL